MSIKTRIEDLTNKQLDYFCAIAQGWKKEYSESSGCFYWTLNNVSLWVVHGIHKYCYHPTTNAEQCMEIMERKKISVNFEFEGCWSADNYNVADATRDSVMHGTTAKRAIIACFVKHELGEEVDCETV